MAITTQFIGMVIVIVVVSLCLWGYMGWKSLGKESLYVTSVTDGDTIWGKNRDSESVNVRIIGIDTPETKHPNKPVEFWGPEASKNAENMLLRRNIVLDYDGRKAKPDKYGRTLAYIEINGKDYGFWAIWNGFAREENYGHKHSKQKLYEFAEFIAKMRNIGLWKE